MLCLQLVLLPSGGQTNSFDIALKRLAPVKTQWVLFCKSYIASLWIQPFPKNLHVKSGKASESTFRASWENESLHPDLEESHHTSCFRQAQGGFIAGFTDKPDRSDFSGQTFDRKISVIKLTHWLLSGRNIHNFRGSLIDIWFLIKRGINSQVTP